MKLTVVSMNKRHYLERWVDCEDKEQTTPNIEYTINCKTEYGVKYQIILSETNGVCGSGYCNATFGDIAIKRVDKFGAYNHELKSDFSFDIDFDEEFSPGLCDVNFRTEKWGGGELNIPNLFYVSTVGGDEYYPGGSVSVNEDLFKPNCRYIKKPIIHIFKGDSCTGKSYLAEKSDKVIFETDKYNELPDEIKADVIVIGNKHYYDVGNIVERIPFDAEIIEVDFKSLISKE